MQQCALGKPGIISELGAGGGRQQLRVFLYLGNCISTFWKLYFCIQATSTISAMGKNPGGLKQKHRMTFEKYDIVLLIVEGRCPRKNI